MDPLSFTASIIAVAGLANTVIKFATNVESFAHDLKTVREELRRAVSHVDFSARLLQTAQRTLKRYCRTNRDEGRSSEVIDFIEDRHVSVYIEEQSQHIEGHVQRLDEQMDSLKDKVTLFVTWKWRHSLRDKLEELRVQMQFIQVSFTLLLNTVQLEHAMGREQTDEIYM